VGLTDVEQSIAELSLQSQLKPVLPFGEASRIYFEALRHFTTAKGNPTWWWEYFRKDLPTATRCWMDDLTYQRIVLVVPDPEEEVLFLPMEDKNLVYRGSPRIIQEVVGNAYYCDEYCLVDLNFRWLLCENHHEVFIGLGEPIASRLQLLTPS
jgi:hypothetical protein